MDVKSMFLNAYIQEEVYVDQPPSLKNLSSPNHVQCEKGSRRFKTSLSHRLINILDFKIYLLYSFCLKTIFK